MKGYIFASYLTEPMNEFVVYKDRRFPGAKMSSVVVLPAEEVEEAKNLLKYGWIEGNIKAALAILEGGDNG